MKHHQHRDRRQRRHYVTTPLTAAQRARRRLVEAPLPVVHIIPPHSWAGALITKPIDHDDDDYNFLFTGSMIEALIIEALYDEDELELPDRGTV